MGIILFLIKPEKNERINYSINPYFEKKIK